MSRRSNVGAWLTLAFALAVASWAFAPAPVAAGVATPPAPQPSLAAAHAAPGCAPAVGPLATVLTPAPASSVPAWMDPLSARKGYCHCGCGPATCHTSADCGGASCDQFPSCC